MKYRLVQSVDGHLIASDFDRDQLLPAMEVRGFEHAGYNANPHQRKELQGQPKFAGLCGPMWDGDRDGVPVIRYEDTEAYARLST